MRRSELDRFIADPSGDKPEVSAEVHVIVTEERRRAFPISWKYLAVPIAIFATAAAISVTSLKSGEGRGHSSSAPVASAAGSGL